MKSLVTAHLETEVASGNNLLYCATFQVAWNQLMDDILEGHPLELAGDPEIARALNKRLVGRQDIAEDCYLAMAGFGRDHIVERIERAFQEKFNRTPELDLMLSSPDDILAYAFLEKSIPFDTKFEVFDEPLHFSDGVEVQAFGIEKDQAAADQVVILDYEDADDFVIKLQGSPQVDAEIDFGARDIERPRITDAIILAQVTPQATLLETVEAVLARADEATSEQAGATLRPREVLKIPKINFDILHRYSELGGKGLLNEGFEGHPISKALQAIKFKLDETGAELGSEAAVKMLESIIIQPRKFIFNTPFLLCLKRMKSKYPYLAIWVDNSELLVKV